MIEEVDNLLPKELEKIINKLQDILKKKEHSKGVIDLVIHKQRQNLRCPKCGSIHIKKNGKYKNRQLYKCKDCNRKFNELTNTPFHHTRLDYKQIETAYECLVDKLPIRKSVKKIGVSTKTAFTLKFKLITCLKETAEKDYLKGKIELDEYYLSVNLKGTKKDKMPRISKPRKKHGTGTSGISKHTVCITSGVDENDHIIFKVAGAGNVTSEMIKKTIASKIQNPTKIVTDCKSSYESVAKENNWNLKQVKSKCYTDTEGNNLANINSLHSELTLFLSHFHGVSTKHLQEYLDWFSFSKYQNYSVDYIEQPDNFEKNTITKTTEIKYSNVCNNYSIFDFFDLYKDYSYQPPKITT